MPQVTELKQPEVYAAIAEVLIDGELPTSPRVRVKLGNRGSPPVLQRFIQTYFHENGARMVRAGSGSADGTVETFALETELRRLTEKAAADLTEAQAKRSRELDDRQAKVEDRESTLAAMEASLKDRERRLDDRELAQAEHLADLRSAASDAATMRDQALADLAAASSEVAALSARLSEKAGSIEVIQRELDAAKALAALVPALQVTEKRLKDELDREQRRSTDLEAELSKAKANLSKLQSDLEAARQKAEQAQMEMSDARIALANTRRELDAAAARLKVCQDALDTATTTTREQVHAFREAGAAAERREQALREVVAERDRQLIDTENLLRVALATSARAEGASDQLAKRVHSLEAMVTTQGRIKRKLGD